VDGKVDGKTLILMARSEGWASYTIYSKDKKKTLEIEITVSDRDVGKINAGGDVIVEGEVATMDELTKVNRILAPYERKGGVRNMIAPAQ
jgi:hypothetical protein